MPSFCVGESSSLFLLLASHMAKVGRPSTFTEELGERIVDAFWSGECRSLSALLAKDWAPPRRTVYKWIKAYPEFGEALWEARVAVSELLLADNDKIVQDMLSGAVEPSAANVAITWNKWKASMADPQNYGNKTQVNTNSTSSVTTEYIHRISLEGLSEEARDAIEIALGGNLLTGPDVNPRTASED